ncbi:MAG: hypothetical protein ACKO7W_21610 [Elainella sp.]
MDTKQVGSAVLAGSILGLLGLLSGRSSAVALSPSALSLVDSAPAQVHQSLGFSHSPGTTERLPAGLIAQAAQPNPVPAAETGCRQTNATTGLYAQPSLDSSSRAILSSGQTVRLELLGTGTGWARVIAPATGWVESRYLSPPTVCTGLGTALPAAQIIAPGMPLASGASTPLPAAAPQTVPTVLAVCEVLPTEGLVVRSEPTISPGTALYTIPKGVHQFQFTNDHLTSHSNNGTARHWAYITAPYPGWISLGAVGGSFNLGGKECG